MAEEIIYVANDDFFLQSDDNSPNPGNINMLVDAESLDMAGEEVDALRGKYIHRLTSVIVYHVPAFWKVALSVFSGKFAKVFLSNLQLRFYT